MEKKDLKKLLASLGVAGLISMGGITLPGAHAGSSWGAKTSAGGTEKQAITPVGSGGSGSKPGAVSAEEQQKMEQMKTEEQSAEEKAKKAAEEETETVKKKTGKSGWGGNKWSCRMHDKKIINDRKPSRAGSFTLPALNILYCSNGLRLAEFTCPRIVSKQTFKSVTQFVLNSYRILKIF
jgi:radical SAM modification target selenobiotic family peptide